MTENILLLNQVWQISAALLAGFFGGLAFDLYQRLCYGGKRRRLRWSAYLKGDAIFASLLVSAWLIFWFFVTDGSLRVSVFLWLAGGFALYPLLFAKRLAKFFHWVKIRLPHPHFGPIKIKNRVQSEKFVEAGASLLYISYKRTSKQTHAISLKIKEKLQKLFARKQKEEEQKEE